MLYSRLEISSRKSQLRILVLPQGMHSPRITASAASGNRAKRGLERSGGSGIFTPPSRFRGKGSGRYHLQNRKGFPRHLQNRKGFSRVASGPLHLGSFGTFLPPRRYIAGRFHLGSRNRGFRCYRRGCIRCFPCPYYTVALGQVKHFS